jgi:DNA-binding MarR family transcriptional regulator
MARAARFATKTAAAQAAPREEGSSVDRGELNEHVGYFARRFQMWIFQDLIKQLTRADVRISHYTVLAIVRATPGLAQSEIAAAVGMEPARLVRVLDELEQRRLIKRTRSISDRRSHAVFLTGEGEKAFDHIRQLARQHEDNVIAKLGPAKYQALLRIFKEIDV